MNYVDIIARQEELEVEMKELQAARIAAAQAHENVIVSESIGNGTSVELAIDYENMDSDIISLHEDKSFSICLTVEQFNKINQFLGKYNDAIFSYMSEITKTTKTEEENVEVAE